VSCGLRSGQGSCRSQRADGIFGTHRVYLYRAIDQFGQVIDVLVSEKRDLAGRLNLAT
jgi:hypothetical protein